MKQEKIYKTLTIILLLAIVGAYITWLKGYTKHLNTCELNHIEKTCK